MKRRSQRSMPITMPAVALLLAVGACGSGNNNANSGAGGSTGAAAAGNPPAASGAGASTSANAASGRTGSDSSRSSTSGGDVAASSDISQMSDSNIVAKLDASDKGEVELARLMETKATSDSVKSYARTLVADHTKSEQQVMTLERQLKLAEKPLKSDTTRQAAIHLLTKFRSMPKGAATDSAFVQHEIEDHQHDIADAKAMQTQAKDAQLQQLIQQTIPVLQKHLDLAQRLSQQRTTAGR